MRSRICAAVSGRGVCSNVIVRLSSRSSLSTAPTLPVARTASTGGLSASSDRNFDGGVDVGVVADALDQAPVLHLVEQAAVPVDVVVLEVDQGHLRVVEGQVVLGPVPLDELVLGDPVALAVETEGILLDLGEA